MVGTRRPVLATVAVAVLLAGCGGSDGADSEGADAVASGDPAGDDVAADDYDFPADCNDVTIAFADVHDAYAASVRRFTPDEPIDYAAQIEAVEAAVAAAPAELRDDFERYGAAVTPFYQGLADMEFDASAPEDADGDAYFEVIQELDVDTVEAAVANIQSWAIGPCLEE